MKTETGELAGERFGVTWRYCALILMLDLLACDARMIDFMGLYTRCAFNPIRLGIKLVDTIATSSGSGPSPYLWKHTLFMDSFIIGGILLLCNCKCLSCNSTTAFIILCNH